MKLLKKEVTWHDRLLSKQVALPCPGLVEEIAVTIFEALGE